MNPSPNSNPNPKPYPTAPHAARTQSSSSGDCDNCATRSPWLLHHVRLRRMLRRLCTSCVLRLHPSSFCPICFSIHGVKQPDREPGELLRCSNCASLTHSRCAPSHPLPPFPFLCPPCSDPTFSFFSPPPGPRVSIDAKMATALLCAAKIAASSMAEAVRAAEEEAGRRAKEAAVCRKRVKEALDKVSAVAAAAKKKTVPPPESGKPKSTA
ncbi:unnamed protein product [Linum trigynum]|uniref:Zinc finger PHD-type domain-containing protein n=1 Tax=Linum trigynum TaxID=586398 RepID=A0AAV2D458_9ROSI